MMNDTDWVIIDTETTGLVSPIHVVEIAGQRMRGWEPMGEPFHAYLNHGVRVPSDAVAIHGLTTEFLRRNGQSPVDAHRAFAAYTGNAPLVAHNLWYDWDQCLLSEWRRLAFRSPATKGFCTMHLGRRVLPEVPRVRLDNLRKLFGLSAEGAHSALGDVRTVIEVFQRVYRPRLEKAGLNTFEAMRSFSRLTLIRKCHERVLKQG